MNDSVAKRSAINRPPVGSTLLVAGAGYYAWLYGPTALPPIIALIFIGCSANVLYGLLGWLGPKHNSLTDVFKGICLMLSLVCGIILVFGLLWAVFSAEPNPLTRLSISADAWALVLNAFVLTMLLLVAAMGLIMATTIRLMVRYNALGAQKAQLRIAKA